MGTPDKRTGFLMIKIKEIKKEADLINSYKLITESFKTVADDFELTKENCPANPAFSKYDQLLEMKEKGIKMFGLFLEKKQVGFIALEQASEGIYYIERLSVLPESRHNGYGKALLDFAFSYAGETNGKKISIAIMDNNKILKDWYIEYGFWETGKKKFDHLPFKVCFMEKNII